MPDPPEPPAPPGAPPGAGWTPVILVGLLLAALSTAPYVRASLSPPPGLAFVGFFWFVDDSYNYLSFVQQAEAGAVLFHNKLVLEDHPAVAVQPGMVDGGRVVAAPRGTPARRLSRVRPRRAGGARPRHRPLARAAPAFPRRIGSPPSSS